MKQLLHLLFLLLVISPELPAQPFGLNLYTAGFHIELYVRDTGQAKTDSTQVCAFFGHTDSLGHFVLQEQIPLHSNFSWVMGDFRNASFTEKPELLILRTAAPQDTMHVRFGFYLPPGYNDTTSTFYRVYCHFRKGTYSVQQLAFGSESESITLPEDQIVAKDSIVRDSAGRMRYAAEHHAYGHIAGWEATWYPNGRLHTLQHFDRQGFPSGYAVTYLENGYVESTGCYSTHYFHYCRTRESDHGTIHAYIMDHRTIREGTWRYYKADGTIREERDNHIVDYDYGDD